MLKSVTLENYKSFGVTQTLELRPLTVLVGPNNSGKSAFMSVGRFLQSAAYPVVHANEVIPKEGGVEELFHRPQTGDGTLLLSAVLDGGTYETRLRDTDGAVKAVEERLISSSGAKAWQETDKEYEFPDGTSTRRERPFAGLQMVANGRRHEEFRSTILPLLQSRLIQLSPHAIRADAPPPGDNVARLTSTGRGLAQVLSQWGGSERSKVTELNAFVQRCLPEIKEVLVVPATAGLEAAGGEGPPPLPGTKRLRVRQKDDQQFDAQRVSDGVLCLIGLAMNAIEAGPGTVIFVEEPEQFVHPTLLHGVVDLFRRVVTEQKCQIVLATHSPRLLSEFRNEPEGIVVFRRSGSGTVTRKLSELPKLAKQLDKYDPGAMLEMGLFDKALEQVTRMAPAE